MAREVIQWLDPAFSQLFELRVDNGEVATFLGTQSDLEARRKLEATLRKSRDAEQKETRHVQDEIARLEALLDATPVLEAPPPAEVTIPRSRPIPKNADVYYAPAPAKTRLRGLHRGLILWQSYNCLLVEFC